MANKKLSKTEHNPFRNHQDVENFLKQGNFAIMTGHSHKVSPEESQQQHQNMIMDIHQMGLPYTHVGGKWGGQQGEPSVIIHGIDEESASKLAQKYGQISHIQSLNGHHKEVVHDPAHNAPQGGTGHVFGPHLEDNYSEIKLPNNDVARFSLNIGHDNVLKAEVYFQDLLKNLRATKDLKAGDTVWHKTHGQGKLYKLHDNHTSDVRFDKHSKPGQYTNTTRINNQDLSGYSHLPHPDSVEKMESLDKTSRNVKEQKAKVFGTRSQPAANSAMRDKHIGHMKAFIKQRYGLNLQPSGGKVDPKTGERRDEAPEVGVDKPDWRSGNFESQMNPEAIGHEAAHLEIMPQGIDLAGGQTFMDKQYADAQKQYGYMSQKKTQGEIQPMAAENPLRRRMGLPSIRRENKVQPGSPERIAVDTGTPAAIRHERNGKQFDQIAASKFLSPENKERIDMVDTGELKYDANKGWVPGTSVDAKINARARAAAQSPTQYFRSLKKKPEKLAASEKDLEKGLLRDSLIAGAISAGMAVGDTVAHTNKSPTKIVQQKEVKPMNQQPKKEVKKAQDPLASQVTSAKGVSDRGIEARRGDTRVQGAVAHGFGRVSSPEKHAARAKSYFRSVLGQIQAQPKPNLPKSEPDTGKKTFGQVTVKEPAKQNFGKVTVKEPPKKGFGKVIVKKELSFEDIKKNALKPKVGISPQALKQQAAALPPVKPAAAPAMPTATMVAGIAIPNEIHGHFHSGEVVPYDHPHRELAAKFVTDVWRRNKAEGARMSEKLLGIGEGGQKISPNNKPGYGTIKSENITNDLSKNQQFVHLSQDHRIEVNGKPNRFIRQLPQHLNDLKEIHSYFGRPMHAISHNPKPSLGYEAYAVGPDGSLKHVGSNHDTSD